jgi:hypothetical protein
MPWTAHDAESKTSKADTPKKRQVWAKVANAALGRGLSDGAAIREANAAVAGIKHAKGSGAASTIYPDHGP